MGEIPEEDKVYLIVDKDTGDVYDSRKLDHLHHLERHSSTKLNVSADGLNSSANITLGGPNNISLNTTTDIKASAWASFWKQKRRNDQDFVFAAEDGNLDKMKKLLFPVENKELASDINAKGLD